MAGIKLGSKKHLPLSSSNSNSSINKDSSPENSNFDAGRIIERYHSVRDEQHSILAQANLSEDLKRLLFGFSESHYLPDLVDNTNDLVIEYHPLKGKTIMTKEKYEQNKIQKERERMLAPSLHNKMSEGNSC